jgi:hypothetical protein
MRWAFGILVNDIPNVDRPPGIQSLASSTILQFIGPNEYLALVELPGPVNFISEVVHMAGNAEIIDHPVRENQTIGFSADFNKDI